MVLKIFFTVAMLGSLSGNFRKYTDPVNKRIVVTGIAENSKGAAIVVPDSGPFYLIDGLDAWDEKYYNKRIKVSGKLVVKEHKQQSNDSIQVQERVGILRILKRPKWELVK